MSTSIEQEKTYLLNSIPTNLEGYSTNYTKDVYLPPQSENPQIRLRQQGEKYYITKKYPLVEGDLSTMVEETIKLSKVEFDFLDSSVKGNVLEKTRYSLKKDNYVIEIDTYLSNLKPLIVLDIEWDGELPNFESIISNFDVNKEITNVKALAGGKIAGKTYDDIKQYI
jgi:CYTH domain-containing protein